MKKEKVTFSQLNSYDDSEALKTFFLEVLNGEINLFQARKEILEKDRLETIERDQANIQRVDAQTKRVVITNNKEESLLYKDIYRNLK